MDLTTVSSDDLLSELLKRHDEAVFIGAFRRTKDGEDFTMAVHGPYHAVVGLIETGKMSVIAAGDLDDVGD